MCEWLSACSQTLTVICQEIQSVSGAMWSLLVPSFSQLVPHPHINSSSKHFWALKLIVITSHVVCCFTLDRLVGDLCWCPGHRHKNRERIRGSNLESPWKYLTTKWLWEISLIKYFLWTIEWHHLLFWLRVQTPTLLHPLFLFLPLYLTLWELMELLWWWCMGVCVNRQMGKCNYGCFRASGSKENLSQKESSRKKDSIVRHVRQKSEEIK